MRPGKKEMHSPTGGQQMFSPKIMWPRFVYTHTPKQNTAAWNIMQPIQAVDMVCAEVAYPWDIVGIF